MTLNIHIRLKVSATIMLLKNFNQSNHLSNERRLQVNYVKEEKMLYYHHYR